MKTKYIVIALVLGVLIALGISYLADRHPIVAEPATSSSSSPQAIDSGTQAAIESAVRAFGSRLKNVSLLAPTSSLSASFDAEYATYVAPELLASWKVDPSQAIGRLTSNPYPDRINVVNVNADSDGSYTVEANVIEVTSASPSQAAAVYPVTLRYENRNGSWLITSVAKGAYSSLPQRTTLTGKQTCLAHRIKTGPQTLECAIGFRADDGKDYALDMSLMPPSSGGDLLNSGNRVRIEGVVTPAEMLSTDRWQKYDMAGIVSVTAVSAL